MKLVLYLFLCSPIFFVINKKVRLNITPMYIVGSTRATCDIQITNDQSLPIIESGVCWSTKSKPNIKDQKVVHQSTTTGNYRLNIAGLSEKTDYHIRAYAITEKGISYSDDFTFKTIAKGKITYTINKDENPSEQQQQVYERLKIAADSAVWYLENYTSASKHVTINYAEGTPTADANSNGWMRFGKNAGFQNLRTMLHEMNHALGTGTTGWWNAKVVDHKFQGTYTNELLKKITKDQVITLNADRQHWWPYGLNQNSEVTSSWDYVYNCIIIEAMRKDGLLTTTSGPYNP